MPKWSFLGIEAKRAGWFNGQTEWKMAGTAHRYLNIKIGSRQRLRRGEGGGWHKDFISVLSGL
jgi:hypothetical protein